MKWNNQFMYKQIICFFAFGFAAITSNHCYSQYFWNTDFEYTGSKNQPIKWAIEGEGGVYHTRLDSVEVKSGKFSLQGILNESQLYVILSIPGNLVAGKNLAIEGVIKTKTDSKLSSGLLLLSPGKGKPIISPRLNNDVNQWQFLSFENTFSNNYASDDLLIAFNISGTGTFWLDTVEIKIDNELFGIDPPDFWEPTTEEIDKLNEVSVPLHEVLNSEEKTDFTPIKQSIGNAQIVALGENSHGSASIYNTKLTLFKYLVTELDFNIFALESPTVEGDLINDFVLGKGGSLNEIKDLLAYKSWQTEEMLNIIKWMQQYNKTAINKVQFRGFDMQNGVLAYRYLSAFAKKQDKELSNILSEIKKLYNKTEKNEAEWNLLFDKSKEVLAHLNSDKLSKNKNISKNEFIKLSHYAAIFNQSLTTQHPFKKTKNRDAYMADNINWIKKTCNECKIVISADNDHIRRSIGKTGYFLDKTHGTKYYTIGFTFNEGTYAAYGPKESYEVHLPYLGTYEYFFSKNKYANYFLDLHKVDHLTIFDKRLGFRTIGSRPQETTQFSELNIKTNFDAIIYLKKSFHTTYLKD